MTKMHMAGPLESVPSIDLSTVVMGSRRTRDGLAAVIPYTPQNFRHLFSAASRPDLGTAPCVDGSALDFDDVEDSSDLVDEALTTAEWAEVCVEHDIPTGPVLRLDHTHGDSYVREGYLLDPVVRPTEGPLRSNGIPVRCSATPGSIRRLAPVPGQGTAHVLTELAATR
ncbi:CoA transferase [Streptomyces sp. NPDC059861]|uniref:CoA transferase n=1 Tax=Streptomyces sp. NPDC059861 TaxID=3346974 RepID=UPI0036572CDE